MASLPSVALTANLKLETELKKNPFSSPATEKSLSISYQRSTVNTQLDGGIESIRHLELQEALSLIKEREKIKPLYYLPLLQECLNKDSVSETQIIHAHMIKTGTHKDFYVMTFLLYVYTKCRAMETAKMVFDNLPRRNTVAWTSLMTGYAQNSQPDLALEVFQNMMETGALPSNYTLGIALNVCSSLNSIKLGKQLHAFIIKYKIDYDTSIGNALCSLYSKFGSLGSAIRVFQGIEEKNVISWTAVVSACGENSEAAMGLKFFINMLIEDIKPNEFTLTTALKLSCVMRALGTGRQVHSFCIKLGHHSNIRIRNAVMYLYLKCGCMDEAQNLFNKMESTSIVTWNAMIAGHVQAVDDAKDQFSAYGSGEKALSTFLKLNRSGMRPDLFTFSSVLTVCSKLMALEQGEQLHAQTIKTGILSDVVVGTALVNMYSKCGSIHRATKSFAEMSSRTLISWTTMITSFAQHGHSQQALLLFGDMQLVGFRPNLVTFVGVLAACACAGMVEEALGYFEMMQKEYRIKPVMDHYGCLISMYVRLGQIDEAFNVIEKMDFDPSEFIWSVLIAGCRYHGKQELGFYAAEKLLKLKPKSAETYIFLLNMYSSAERWEDVSKVKKLMEEEKIEKLKDCSWISIKNKVHSFETNDSLHLRNVEIHKLLDELLDRAKALGYQSPEQTDKVIIDYDKEEKGEKRAFSSAIYHSEMLAIAFGLLNIQKDATIGIVKIVSMCRNCHDFVKVVSLVCNREIIIRDAKRLHRFVNGHCSCADFCDLL